MPEIITEKLEPVLLFFRDPLPVYRVRGTIPKLIERRSNQHDYI
jgi:hypothetical protein